MSKTFPRLSALAPLALFTALIFSPSIFAQAPGSGARSIKSNIEEDEARVAMVIERAENHFKLGEINLKDNRREQARDEFDKAVDEILNSSLDVRSHQNLRVYYLELIKRVYCLEVPTGDKCGPVENLNQQLPQNVAVAMKDDQQQDELAVGFKDQKFEPSPLDELSKLILTPVELTADPADMEGLELAKNEIDFKFNVNPLIQGFINYYQGRGRSTMETGLRRSGQFMTMARKIFREEGVPEDIVWLGQVESGWRAKAYSPAAASGLWQFIPSTGRNFGLRQTAWIDERNSYEKATRASARYLKFLANRYNGDWLLALAAYNTGEGNIDRAIQRAGRADYWATYPYIAQETRNYVPSILATILIAKNRDKYGFTGIRPDAPLAYDVIEVQSATSLQLIAKAAGTSVDYIQYLNPELRKDVTPRGEAYRVRIPAGRAVAATNYIKGIPANMRDQSPRLTQSGCLLTLSQAPEIRGFRLGMTVGQVKERTTEDAYFDELSRVSEFGERSIMVSGYQLKGESSKGVSEVEFGFLDDKLTLIKVTYDRSVKWNSPQEFISRVVEALGLPASDYNGQSRYRLDCDGFFVEIYYSSGIMPSVRIYNPETARIVEKRRADKEEKKRREFKP